MKDLGKLPPADKPQVGQAANRVKDVIEERTAAKLDDLVNAAPQADLARSVDVTMPARPVGQGTCT
jgi:phenylalanyl-tRNA synthetase alpha chain